ncbi:hypothetical protein DUT90_13110 [Polaribacter sp. WD7]|uniref:heparinase II/III domain-containing protein n=1 Tax=Polaribacter sp. WD7 TaxID=2269061 RepID=UPI000DF1404C|nr:heparinase II/III family protein [Polaribacter sp. WD7]RCS26677.1 hypothetical protein DUT90_13110 [Polaribacter sp. WD7]
MKKIIFVIFAFFTLITSSQSLQHPTIFATLDQRESILELIEKYDWAKSIKLQLHLFVDPYLSSHQRNPRAILDRIPEFAKNSRQHTEFQAHPFTSKHHKILALASKSAMLYYLTQNVKYAKFSADILMPYINEIVKRNPKNTTISGNAFYDPRTTYVHFALAYDFIYEYLKSSKATVFDNQYKKRVPFNNAKAQKAIKNMIGDMLQEYGKPDKYGSVVSNHPILTGPGALFAILCVEDDVERERLFHVFWEKGTAHQNSFTKTILPLFGKQGIWPESLSYSFMPAITMMINVVDRIKPELNITKEYNYIFEGNFLFDNLRYPDRTFVRFGDSKRNKDLTEKLYRYTLDLATRRGYKELEQKAQIALTQAYSAKGGYKPKLTNDTFDNFRELQLFWGHPIPKSINKRIDFQKPTVIIEHAGIALQRNDSEKNNVNYGLTGVIGGAHYVHSHVTGISMELYGAGHVMAPNAGLPETVQQRRVPLHENYFRLYAGNNTVIVNGTSHGRDEGSWKGNAYVWQNTAKNIAAEPKHLQDPIAKEFSFATQLLEDEVNNAKQQRTLGIVRTSETSGYYLDIFRSKSYEENKFHDYVYHNIGDKTILQTSEAKTLKFKKTKRYQNDIGDPVQSPGWRFFEKEKVSQPIKNEIHIRFDVSKTNRYMHMFVPEGVQREYTKAVAPPTREAKDGYDKKKTQVVVIRQKGEAWKKPFVTVFEPTIGEKSSVKSVEVLEVNNKVVGAKVLSYIDGKEITDYIISNDVNEAIVLPDLDLKFEGRYAIVRIRKNGGNQNCTLYIGDGKNLAYQGKKVVVEKGDSKAIKKF